jgi:hypothetical protein
MKKFYIGLLFISVSVGTYAQKQTRELQFSSSTDLTDKFNDDGSPEFTLVATGGLGDGGAINVPIGSDDIWTTKEGYSVSGVGDKYTVEAYFKVAQNSGYGGVGLAANSSNTNNSPGYADPGLGVTFHGGGGSFHSNGTSETLDWYGTSGDLVLGNWYKLVFVVEAVSANTYNLSMTVYNSDADGVVGTVFTENTWEDVVNNEIGGASTLHTYFSSTGSRMEKIDNYKITLEGGISIIEEGEAVVITKAVGSITTSSAVVEAEVISDNGVAVSERGICWSTSATPMVSDNKNAEGNGVGVYSSTLSGLTPATTYYARSYAINETGTSYGAEVSFTTSSAVTGILKNAAGVTNVYPIPTKSSVTVSLAATAMTIQAKIMNTNGQIVDVQNFASANELNINLEGIAGMYFIDLVTSDGKHSMIKVVKE